MSETHKLHGAGVDVAAAVASFETEERHSVVAWLLACANALDVEPGGRIPVPPPVTLRAVADAIREGAHVPDAEHVARILDGEPHGP